MNELHLPPPRPSFLKNRPEVPKLLTPLRRRLRDAYVAASDRGWLGLVPVKTHVVICGFPRSGTTLLQLMVETSTPRAKAFGNERSGLSVARYTWPVRSSLPHLEEAGRHLPRQRDPRLLPGPPHAGPLHPQRPGPAGRADVRLRRQAGVLRTGGEVARRLRPHSVPAGVPRRDAGRVPATWWNGRTTSRSRSRGSSAARTCGSSTSSTPPCLSTSTRGR